MQPEKSSQWERITPDELFAGLRAMHDDRTYEDRRRESESELKPPCNVEELFRLPKHLKAMYPSQGLLEYYLQRGEPVPEWFLKDHDEVAFPVYEGLYQVFSDRITPRAHRMEAWSNVNEPFTQPWPRDEIPDRMYPWVHMGTRQIVPLSRRLKYILFYAYHPPQKLKRSKSEPDVYKEKMKDKREVFQRSRTDLDVSKFPEAFSITQNIFDKVSRTTPDCDPHDFESLKRIYLSHISQFDEFFHGMCHIIEKNPNMKRTSTEEACALLLLTEGFITICQDIAKIVNRLWKYFFIINDKVGLDMLYNINFQKDRLLQIIDRINEMAEINNPEVPRTYTHDNSIIFRLIKTAYYVYKKFLIPVAKKLKKHPYPIRLPKPEEISGRDEYKNILDYVKSIRFDQKLVDLPKNETVQYLLSTQTQMQEGDTPEIKLANNIEILKRILSTILEIFESDRPERQETDSAQFVCDVINGVQWTREPIDECIKENYENFNAIGNTEAADTMNVINNFLEEITQALHRINQLAINNEPIQRLGSDRFETSVKGLIKDCIGNLDQMEILVSEAFSSSQN